MMRLGIIFLAIAFTYVSFVYSQALLGNFNDCKYENLLEKIRKLELKTDTVEEEVETMKKQQGEIFSIIYTLIVNSLFYAKMFKERSVDHDKFEKRIVLNK